MPIVDKGAVIDAAVELLQERLRETMNRAKATAESAMHEEAKAEDQYDTRALEETYLAAGQAKRAGELAADLAAVRQTPRTSFEGRPVDVGALVVLEGEDGARRSLLVVPAAGGLIIDVGGERVQLITVGSPLARALLGREEGDEVEAPARGGAREYEVVTVR